MFSTLWWLQFLSAAATIAIVNYVVGGVFIALAITYSLNQGPPLGIAVGIGAAVAIGIAFLRHQWATMMGVVRSLRRSGVRVQHPESGGLPTRLHVPPAGKLHRLLQPRVDLPLVEILVCMHIDCAGAGGSGERRDGLEDAAGEENQPYLRL